MLDLSGLRATFFHTIYTRERRVKGDSAFTRCWISAVYAPPLFTQPHGRVSTRRELTTTPSGGKRSHPSMPSSSTGGDPVGYSSPLTDVGRLTNMQRQFRGDQRYSFLHKLPTIGNTINHNFDMCLPPVGTAKSMTARTVDLDSLNCRNVHDKT